MKKFILGLALTTISSVTFAGSYGFECTAYHLDKESNQISKLTMNREGATLDNYPGILLYNSDPNISLLDGTQTYVNVKKGINVKATVKALTNIVSLSGSLGPRENDVEMNSVSILVERNGIKELYQGSCTETTISSCGGSCI